MTQFDPFWAGHRLPAYAYELPPGPVVRRFFRAEGRLDPWFGGNVAVKCIDIGGVNVLAEYVESAVEPEQGWCFRCSLPVAGDHSCLGETLEKG